MKLMLILGLSIFCASAFAAPKECETPSGNIAIVKAYLENIGHPVTSAILCDPNYDGECMSQWRNLVVVRPKAQIGFDPRCHLAETCPGYVMKSGFDVYAPENNCVLYRETPVQLSTDAGTPRANGTGSQGQPLVAPRRAAR